MSKDTLIQLPDGTWVRPSSVTMIRVMPGIDGSHGTGRHPPRVAIHAAGDFIRLVFCESEEDAERVRDEVATMVREAEAMGGDYPVENHAILDVIHEGLTNGALGKISDVAEQITRESECLEFHDPDREQWYEVVVRPTDALDDAPTLRRAD